MNQRQKQVETICEEPRHEYQQENHAGINLGLFTPSPTDYDTEEAILANRLIKKKKKPKRNRFFKEYAPRYGYKYLCTKDEWLQVLLDPWIETYTQRIFQTI